MSIIKTKRHPTIDAVLQFLATCTGVATRCRLISGLVLAVGENILMRPGKSACL